MSGSLLEVKKKINGTKNTRKITKAMQLVAASKMRQFQKRAIHARGYVEELYKALENNSEAGNTSIFTEERDQATKTLFVLYTSDKGLCGALNNKLINALFRSEKWTETKEQDRMLISIGKKSTNFAKANKINIEKEFVGVSEQMTNIDALEIVDQIITMWKKNKEIKEVIFIAPHYKSSLVFYPTMKTFLPLQAPMTQPEEKEEIEDINDYMFFTPDKETVLKKLYEQIIQSAFIQAFLELKASEYSSRMIAMQNATDAADKMIVELKRQFNKARQQAITQEIAELIGAKMALEEE